MWLPKRWPAVVLLSILCSPMEWLLPVFLLRKVPGTQQTHNWAPSPVAPIPPLSLEQSWLLMSSGINYNHRGLSQWQWTEEPGGLRQESELCARCALNPEAALQGTHSQKRRQALCLRQNLLDARGHKVCQDLLKGPLFRMSPVEGLYH